MKTVLVSLLQEHGHLNPSFKVSRTLASQGFDVQYFGIPDFEDYIRAQGFEYVPFFPDLFPRGFTAQQDQLGFVEARRALTARFSEIARRLLAPDGFRRQVEKLAPAAMIIDINHTHVAMFAQMIGIPKVAMNVTLPQTKDPGIPPIRTGTPFQTGLLGRAGAELSWQKLLWKRKLAAKLAGVAGMSPQFELARKLAPKFGLAKDALDVDTVYMPRLRGVHELVLCPEAFDFPRPPDPTRHYVESIDLARKEADFPWDRVDPAKPLIYIAMGSQRYQPKYVQQLLRTCVEVMARRPAWQAIVAVGRHLSPEELSCPANVVAVKSAPQLSVLKKAKLMVTHGGLGSVKECIVHGVPMIAFPLAVDQPGNAVRVDYHRIGIAGDVRTVSHAGILSMLDRVLAEPEYRERIALMRARFEETESGRTGAGVVASIASH
jgi:UDP:flavonoid glycosyltransferase YjiC (YdhE family)